MTGLEVLELPLVNALLTSLINANWRNWTDVDTFLRSLNDLNPRKKDDGWIARHMLEGSTTVYRPEMHDLIHACAIEMRMIDESGKGDKIETSVDGMYDLCVVLGGARHAPLDRTYYAADFENLISDIIVVGSTRLLQDKEKTAVADYAPDAVTEYDLCNAAAAIVSEAHGMPIATLWVANPNAGTPDVIAAAIEDAMQSLPIESVVAVTTQIYQTSASLDVRRVAKEHGIDPEMAKAAGCPSKPNVVKDRNDDIYLAEVLRTIRAAAMAAQAGV